ncbi:MAG: alpha-galactosidase [Bacilli bacterium]|nr:alpha-galactosidase [Bacilli bacterium]
MIVFDSDNKFFHLKNKDLSYVFYVNQLGVLIKLYYGQPIHDLGKEHLESINELSGDAHGYLDSDGKEVIPTSPRFAGSYLPQEIPTFLSYDKRPALFKIEHSDGSKVTDFRYVSHTISKGKPALKGLPSLREGNCETLCVLLKDQKDDVFVEAYYTIYDDCPILLRHNRIINKSKNVIRLFKAGSLCLDLPSNDYSILSLHGTYATDREIETTRINHNIVTIDENAGGKGFYHNPMGMLIKDGTNTENGEAIGFGLIYSGNFAFNFAGTQMEQIRAVLGLNEENFCFYLESGEDFVTPEAFLVYSNKGTYEVTHQFHNIIREHLLRPIPKGFEKTVLLNSWEGTYFNFNTELILSYLDKAKEMGVTLFVLDDGWFGNRDDDTRSLGDWEVNKNKIDLKKVVDYAHEIGLKFGLWIEPEMINPDSNLFREHPEYALYDRGLNPTTFRHQLVLDLTNPEVVDVISEKIISIFKTYGLDYCKWDFNRILTEPVSPFLTKERQGEVFHRFMLGTYEMMSRFVRSCPNILFETCSGGGGRFDMGMLAYCHQIWGSDETDGPARTYIHYSTNLFYPLQVLGAHVSARKYLSIKEKAAIAMFGTYGYELNPLKLSEKDISDIRECNELYLSLKDTIYNGDYYPLINPYDGSNFVSWEVVSKDKNSAAVFLMNYHLINWRSRFLKIKGLDPNKLYKNSLDGSVFYGDFYANVGLNVTAGRDNFTDQVISFTVVNE